MMGKELFAWVVLAAAGSLPLSVSGQEGIPPSLPELILVQVPGSGSPGDQDNSESLDPLDRYLEGSRIIRLDPASGGSTILTPEFTAACDPDVSFDGRTILFAGKRDPGASWQIWRMNADGSRKVQITRGPGHHLAPIHAGARFYLDDPEPTPQIIFAGNEDGSPVLSLYGTDREGRSLHRLTFNPLSDFSPALLPTGRIVFGSRRVAGGSNPGLGGYPRAVVSGAPGTGIREDGPLMALLSVNLDGTDLMPFHGSHVPPGYRDMPAVPTEGDRVYFVESDHPSRLGGGNLAYVSWRRPLSSYQPLQDGSGGEGIYHSPRPLPDGRLLVSHRPRGPGSLFNLYQVDPDSGRLIQVVFQEAGWHSIDAQILAPRPPVKGRSNWLRPGSTTGVFYCLDAYRTNLDEDGDSLVAPRGTIKHVRVLEGPSRRILGVAPVEVDGSFHIRVPSETPIAFQLLDENYMALHSQQSWIWVMGNENRGCIGCHEDRELSPPNRVPAAIPRAPADLTLPPARRRTVDFRTQIGPMMNNTCATAGCHGAGAVRPALGPTSAQTSESDLQNVYESLMGLADPPTSQAASEGAYIVPGQARLSPLIQLLLDAPRGSESGESLHRNLLPRHDLIRLIEWVDLGAIWEWDTEHEGSKP